MNGRALQTAARPVIGAGKLGMWIFLATDLMTFGGLFFAHLYLRSQHPEWPSLTRVPGLALPGAMTAVLLGSSVLMLLALRRARAGDRRAAVRSPRVVGAPRALPLSPDQPRLHLHRFLGFPSGRGIRLAFNGGCGRRGRRSGVSGALQARERTA